MDIIGRWKIKELHMPTEDGEVILMPETVADNEEYENEAKMMGQVFEFTPDGILNILMPVPEELRAEVEAEGITITADGYAVIKTTTWKEQDGKLFYDNVETGEIMDEAVNPFEELKVTPDGCLLYDYESHVLEKI